MEPTSNQENQPGRQQSGRTDGSYPGASSGYGYGGYGYGYGYGETTQAHRSFQDYMLILRERMWYIVVVFLVVFSSALVYTLSRTKIYEAVATVQVFRRDPVVMQVQGVVDNEIRSAEDLNTQVKILESATIIQKVSERITGDDLQRFLAPYQKGGETSVINPAGVITRNRKILPQRLTLVIAIQYEHPDPAVAVKVANLFADEYLTYNSRVRMEDSMRAVDDLKERADDQRKRVEDLGKKLQAYREKNNLVSLDQRKDIVSATLQSRNQYADQTKARLKEAEIRWNQVQERQKSGGDLVELPFIATNPLIGQLTQQLAAQKIAIAQLRQRYRDKHPKMNDALKALTETERELKKATDTAAAAVESEYQSAVRNDAEARIALASATADSLELDRFAVDYNNLERELKLNENILQNTMSRMRETTMTSTIQTPNARILDHAALPKRPIFPNVPLNLGLGLIGGLGLGLAFAFFVAYIDDRVKSSFDIEGVVGLPLIGIIPEIKSTEQSEKAQIVVNNADRQVAEAFLTLHSSLRLKNESKNAKCILITSTIPSEGKSFMTTNLALTFAAHGERVVVIDCDLRKPNIHKSFKLENLKGIIDICTGRGTIDDVVVRNVHPNFDIITSGGRSKNPTHILNSKEFELMLSDLRKRYDRVFIDTPPLAAVSDALIILPLTDGSIFTIFFNKVRRKAVQFSAKRLLDANVPNFGAVLNGLNLTISGYYYAQYHDKSYKDYYVTASKKSDERER
jgi:succinoglycan biosynthesis transport protein ExoP